MEHYEKCLFGAAGLSLIPAYFVPWYLIVFVVSVAILAVREFLVKQKDTSLEARFAALEAHNKDISDRLTSMNTTIQFVKGSVKR